MTMGIKQPGFFQTALNNPSSVCLICPRLRSRRRCLEIIVFSMILYIAAGSGKRP